MSQSAINYVVPATPAHSVVTGFSYNASAAAGSVRLAMFVPGAGTDWTLVGKSPLMAVTPSTLNTFPARVPVPAGAHLGMQITAAGMTCVPGTGNAADSVAFSTTFDPGVSTSMTGVTPLSSVRVAIAAVVESDDDGDGYGDVTQDLCPQAASAQLPCPAPDTIVTKKPKKHSTKRKAKIAFTSSVPGGTFTCSIDGRSAVSCSSPFKKKFKYGKHRVAITAVNAAGIADLTPAIVKFKINRPR